MEIRKRAGMGAIATMLLGAAPPAVGAGAATMGYEWAAWTGPWQVGFGLLCGVVGVALGAYALGIDRLLQRPGLDQYIDTADAGRWLYARAPDSLRDRMRGPPWESIQEAGEAYVKGATGESKACPLFVIREPGLPVEEVDPESMDFSVFESVFGTDKPPMHRVLVRRRDLAAILRYYRS